MSPGGVEEPLRTKIKWTAVAFAVLVCLAAVSRFPTNRYEWMLELDPLAETLPVDPDAGSYPWVAGVPILVLALVLFSTMTGPRERRVSALILLVLVGLWYFRFQSLL